MILFLIIVVLGNLALARSVRESHIVFSHPQYRSFSSIVQRLRSSNYRVPTSKLCTCVVLPASRLPRPATSFES
ncbi:hypothetical protein F5Y17DRAFT_32975 [Xylariaceae sp. FL0594]|nr:hypothetical protein F5Y17DRAFT_32975 [Xylariaceae sp. FL0594]